MSFPAYPKYKDSGVEWLGQIPDHWRVDRIKASVASARNGIWGEEADGEGFDIPCVRVADFDRGMLSVKLKDPTLRKVTERERIGRVIKRGDLLLEKSGGGEGQPVGCVVLYEDDEPAVCSNFVAKVELSDGMNSSFWRYVHAAAYSIRLTTCSINQTSGIQNLDQAAYFNEKVGFPPADEQSAIAKFLDHETAKIDALIEEQDRLIDLLREQRIGFVSHLVTSGINRDVGLTDSGVSWLGMVPSHWKVLPIKRIVDTPVTDGPHETPDFIDAGIPFVSAEAVSSGVINFEKIRGYISQEDHLRYSIKYKPKRSDIYLVKSGATTGVSAIVDSDVDFNIWSPLAVIRCGSTVLPRFALHFIRSKNFLEAIELGWSFGTQQNIGMGVIENLVITIPPIDEQIEIIKALDDFSSKAEALISEARRGIELLSERRKSLIAAAVTGKIDVRGWNESGNKQH